jgi:hypothetical protein
MALFLFTKAILAGEPVNVFNHGQMQRDFTYIDDIVEGVVRTLDRAPVPDSEFNKKSPDPAHSWAPCQVFNIGNHGPAGLHDYLDALEEALGRCAERYYLPMQPGDVPATFADTTLLTEWTGHKPGTPIRAGIRQFATWYSHYMRDFEKAPYRGTSCRNPSVRLLAPWGRALLSICGLPYFSQSRAIPCRDTGVLRSPHRPFAELSRRPGPASARGALPPAFHRSPARPDGLRGEEGGAPTHSPSTVVHRRVRLAARCPPDRLVLH